MIGALRILTLASLPGLAFGAGLGDVRLFGISLACLIGAWATSPGTVFETLRNLGPFIGRAVRAASAAAFIALGTLLALGGFAIGRLWVIALGGAVAALGILVARDYAKIVAKVILTIALTRRPEVRTHVRWGDKRLPAKHTDQRFYFVLGPTGTGKSIITKNFIKEWLAELAANPHAKLVIFDPKREFYAWLLSMNLGCDLYLFHPSDKRSVAIAFEKDYEDPQDSQAIATAFFPHDPNEKARFWADSLRTIYSAVFTKIRDRMGYVDLRLMCSVLESEESTKILLGYDPYFKAAQDLVGRQGGEVNETLGNIRHTISSRITDMKVVAAQQTRARKERDPFSIAEFLDARKSGILVISVDKKYATTQEPINSLVLSRMIQMLEHRQSHPRRKIAFVLDEVQEIAGTNVPCPGMNGLLERLRSRGIVAFLTSHSTESLEIVYGEKAAKVMQMNCRNTMTLSVAGPCIGIKGQASRSQIGSDWTDWIYGQTSWSFHYPPSFAEKLPKTHPAVREYEEREASHQILEPLTMTEKRRLGLVVATYHGGPRKPEEAADIIATLSGNPEDAEFILRNRNFYRERFRKAAKLWHPDHEGGNEEQMRLLNAARDILEVHFGKTGRRERSSTTR